MKLLYFLQPTNFQLNIQFIFCIFKNVRGPSESEILEKGRHTQNNADARCDRGATGEGSPTSRGPPFRLPISAATVLDACARAAFTLRIKNFGSNDFLTHNSLL